jgi:uroporphyrin-III C-methyltransferase
MGRHAKFPPLPEQQSPNAAPAVVHFVGAGPGDPCLLTVRATQLLREADAILHDALVSGAILDLAPRRVQRIAIGKRAGRHSVAQSEINRLLVRMALAGKRIVRLKGGDPAIFARLAEEIGALQKAGIPYAIVPGITAASAAAAAAGIPLTMRGEARRVQFIAAHSANEGDAPDWSILADKHATTVFYMPRQGARAIAKELTAHGLRADMPVLLTSDIGGSQAMQLHVPLAALPDAVKLFPVAAPLIVIIGEVVNAASNVFVSAHAQELAVP